MDTIDEESTPPYILINIQDVYYSFRYFNIELKSIKILRKRCIITGRRPNNKKVQVTYKYHKFPPRVSYYNITDREIYHYNDIYRPMDPNNPNNVNP